MWREFGRAKKNQVAAIDDFKRDFYALPWYDREHILTQFIEEFKKNYAHQSKLYAHAGNPGLKVHLGFEDLEIASEKLTVIVNEICSDSRFYNSTPHQLRLAEALGHFFGYLYAFVQEGIAHPDFEISQFAKDKSKRQIIGDHVAQVERIMKHLNKAAHIIWKSFHTNVPETRINLYFFKKRFSKAKMGFNSMAFWTSFKQNWVYQ